ncbi:MAG: Glycosyl transferase, group 2 family protein [Candidatus Collierbacteria bacterium GW2011_GWB2_45_17]|uniref:Glycosyl transferase, group 2 family protein n=1 Tax=Candidatus Collierbacteria bacterium GW2011_GWB2_45_17 TaxID=1618388 RepID=A0A837IG36_9BACT|nr:MAG: Glycosyl transferase, group 2 family protein [Microgenomates group bacterium GW2011_GWC1_44_23]KKT94671.1 MAG: Glycosyl transferase, group 2 family protein [Candidatus Collierbacteria bacterium GW2011_GWA1_45_15]KKT99577.1 MAG: Glycosyl transferase, group 2 family protein [Candidatus Collierbacteria bacterium GW2011_GWB2_45_17]
MNYFPKVPTFPKVAIIIPAQNEQKNIVRAIRSADQQTHPNKKIIVAVDNSSDYTYQIAKGRQSTVPNLTVFYTYENHGRKAGALNQAIDLYCQDADFIMVLDADTIAAPDVITEALRVLSTDSRLGAVCALTHLTPLPKNATFDQKIIWQLQKLEYASADSRRVEHPEDLQVLAGTCVVFRPSALVSVAKLIRQNGQYYDQTNLTEDYELTLSLKKLGWLVTIGSKMHSWTDVPLSFSVHWHQRIRWARYHMDTLRQKGWNKDTRKDILSHVSFSFLFTQQITFAAIATYLVITGTPFVWNPLLWVVVVLYWVDRMYRLKYVDNLTPADVTTRALIIPEEMYILLHSVERIWSYWLSFVNGPEEWRET